MKKLRHIFVISILIFSHISFSQSSLSFQWMKNSTGKGCNQVIDMIVDSENNILLIGNFTDTLNLDGNSANGTNKYFVAKYTSGGECLWLKDLAFSGKLTERQLFINKDGEVFINNYINDTVKDKTQSFKQETILIENISNSGGISRKIKLKGDFDSEALYPKTLNGSEFLVGGKFRKIYFDDNLYQSHGEKDIFILKDSLGGDKKVAFIEGLGQKKINQIETDNRNNIYVIGEFSTSISIENIILKSNGRKDAYIAKFNSNLELIYLKSIGGIFDDSGISIVVDSHDNIIVSGTFTSKIITETSDTLFSSGKLDVFSIKYNSNGQQLWANCLGGKANDYLTSCFLNSFDELYLTGNYRGAIKKQDHSVASANFTSDVFLAKISIKGELQYIESVGGVNTDFISKIETDSLGYIYLSGNFNKSTVAFDKSSKGSKDEEFYLLKLYDCSNEIKVKLPNDTSICNRSFVIEADTGFSKYIWNEIIDGSNKLTVDSTNNYFLKVFDNHGCISNDTILVEINQPDQVDLGDDIYSYVDERILLKPTRTYDEYQWSTNEYSSFIEINTSNYNPGEHPINLQVKDINGCISEDDVILTVIDKEIICDIYPNPVRDKLIIKIQNLVSGNNLKVQLINEWGSIIKQREFIVEKNNLLETISIGEFPRGIYYLKIFYSDVVKINKIVKL